MLKCVCVFFNICEQGKIRFLGFFPCTQIFYYTHFYIFVVTRTDIFHIILPASPTLKYPLHAPAKKSSFSVNTTCEQKVFDYDCVTLYDMPI